MINIYICLECVDGKCRKNSLPNNCLEYRYKIGTNDVECIKCENDYYLSDGNCNGCYYQYYNIEGGIYNNYYCSGGNHNKINYCSCISNYALKT